MSSAPQGPYRVKYVHDGSDIQYNVTGPTEHSRSDSGFIYHALADDHASDLNAAYHEGRESVMAERGDLLYTDNSAVVAKLSAENERLRAAHLLLMALGQSDGPLSWGPIVAKARAYYLAHP
jgi:hypothetical protein